eukprot:6942027-Prymnesium_polylepis.1
MPAGCRAVHDKRLPPVRVLQGTGGSITGFSYAFAEKPGTTFLNIHISPPPPRGYSSSIGEAT